MVQFISDGMSIPSAQNRYLKRREWLMKQCNGPIVLSAPKYGPNQLYPWAHCDVPVYQDSYILYLTGINQLPLHLVLDPQSNQQHIFIPDYNSKYVFWDGYRLAKNDVDSESFLFDAGFTSIHSIKDFPNFINQLISKHPNWHFLIHEKGRKRVKDDSYRLFNSIRRKSKQSFNFTNISQLSWEHRASHDSFSIDAFKEGIKKTAIAYHDLLYNCKSLKSEYELSGYLKGELLKQSPFGLSFPPIVARNQNAAILHYTDCCDSFQVNDLVLLDFGIRWQSMCTDISRTISLSGKYSHIQKLLLDIVKSTQEHVISKIKAGISFDDLNQYCWEFMESSLEKNFTTKGGRYKREYNKQPHNVGHLLGIQTHDGDPFRSYRDQGLKENSIITVEPGLYGEFEFNGESIHCGIRIEDNILVTKTGAENLSIDIPK